MTTSRTRRFSRYWVMAGIALLVAAPLSLSGNDKDHAKTAHGKSDHSVMTDEDMRRWVEDWFATHPEVGRSDRVQGIPSATFEVGSNFFDADGSPATIDTAKIMVGETVLWQNISGFHTVTSGTGSNDPQVAQLFDVENNVGEPTFQFTYNDPGIFPFFCRPHELSNMRGFVEVQDVVGVGPRPETGIGFTASPSPNPSASSMRFGFAVGERGRVRADVYDAQGRFIARAIDGVMSPGAYSAAWNGLDEGGNSVRTGVYYLRLRLEGYDQSRRIVIAR